jgi:hypothetical protein
LRFLQRDQARYKLIAYSRVDVGLGKGHLKLQLADSLKFFSRSSIPFLHVLLHAQTGLDLCHDYREPVFPARDRLQDLVHAQRVLKTGLGDILHLELVVHVRKAWPGQDHSTRGVSQVEKDLVGEFVDVKVAIIKFH